MDKKDSYTSEEWKEAVKHGLIVFGKKGRPVLKEPLPAFKSMIEKEQKLISEIEKDIKDNVIFIPFNVASSKNSKQWTGKLLIKSKTARKYYDNSMPYWEQNKTIFHSLIINRHLPLHIGFHFIRNSRHKFDFCNLCQFPQDIMVKTGWIEDDNVDIMLPYPYLINEQCYTYNKENPGVLIKIM